MALDWFYKGKLVTELPSNTYGFIYRLRFENDLQYIGKKEITSYTTRPIKKDLSQRPGHIEFFNKLVMRDPDTGNIVVSKEDKVRLRKLGVKAIRQTYEKTCTESDWKTYLGSSEETEGHTLIYKEILEFAPTAKSLTYLEEKYLFSNEVLENELYLNKSIRGVYYKGDLL